MSANDSNPAATPASAGSTHPNDHIHLRVTYLQAGNPRPPHDLGAIPGATTIGELKSRLQHDLLEHPRPEEQRLIYQGRPLMQNNVTLKEALRLDGPIGPLPYTIHVIIQPRQAASHFRPSHPTETPQTLQSPTSPTQNDDHNGQPQPQPELNQNLRHLQQIQGMMQSQLRMIEQQMSNFTQTTLPAQAQQPQTFSTSFQIHGPPTNNIIQPPHEIHQTFSGNPNFQAMLGQQQAQRYVAAAQRTHDQSQPSSTQPQGPAATNNRPQANSWRTVAVHNIEPPFQRPSSAPGHADRRRNAQSESDHLHRMSQTQQMPQMPHMRHMQTPIAGFPQAPVPGNVFPAHLPPPFWNRPAASTRSTQQTTVWLASSGNGPEALLFAPGHGFFSSATPTSRTGGSASATSTIRALPSNDGTTVDTAQPAATGQTQQAQHGTHAHLAVQRNRQEQGVAPQVGAENRNRNAENDDIFALIVQRGWLFLRLYMFMFVLSEPGTWRRYFLLALALIVCLLPRENPLNSLFAMARRHIDNLIGLPNPQLAARAREPGQTQGREPNDTQGREARQQQDTTRSADAAANTGPSSSRRQPRGAVNTTPEETAQRLLEEHRQRNPNVLLDTFWRIEQAIALFLASLIPGVGEGQVAAREQQRRDRERERREREEAQQRDEENRQQAEQTRNDQASSPPDEKSVQAGSDTQPATFEEATSSSVEPRAEVEEGGMRARLS